MHNDVSDVPLTAIELILCDGSERGPGESRGLVASGSHTHSLVLLEHPNHPHHGAVADQSITVQAKLAQTCHGRKGACRDLADIVVV